MIKDELEKAGLDEHEAKAYLATLELGETTISRIAKKSGIKRTTTYLAIESLKNKGLITSIKKNKKTFFYAEDPRVLEQKMEERKRSISKIIPELLSITNLIDKKPKVRYFEGQEGMKEIFKDTLHYFDQEICAWFSKTHRLLGAGFYNDYYIPRRREKKIWIRAIFPENESGEAWVQNNQASLRRTRFVEAENFEMPMNVMLYGKSKVGILSYEENMAMIIESEDVYKSLQSIFEVMWELLPER